MTVSFHTTKPEFETIELITDRAMRVALAQGIGKGHEFKRTLQMDVTACHANGCRLKLHELMNAPDFDFAHDVFGIQRHIDRDTGKLGHCFVPRYAERQNG